MAEEKDNTIETIEKIIDVVSKFATLMGPVGTGLTLVISTVINQWNGPEQTKEQLQARIQAQVDRDLSWK